MNPPQLTMDVNRYSLEVLKEFVAKKVEIDPHCRFSSLWYNHYLKRYEPASSVETSISKESSEPGSPKKREDEYQVPVVSERRLRFVGESQFKRRGR